MGRVDEATPPTTFDGGAPDGGAPDAVVEPPPAPDASDAAPGVPGAFAWSKRAPLPIPRTELGAAVVDGKIYAFGGFSGSLLARVDVYDPTSNVWTRKADMQTARRSFASAAIDGKIYVSAGMAFTDYNAVTWLTSTEVYDPATDTWTARAPCPIATDGNNVWGNRFVGGGAMDGKLYVVAFDAYATQRNAMYVYDPATDQWTTKSTASFGTGQFGVAPLGGSLHVFVSPYFDPPPGRLWSWEPGSDTWISRGMLPPWRSAFLATGGKLYTMGGVTGTPATLLATGMVQEWDPATTTWTERGALSVAREYPAAAELAGHVYVIGGDVGNVPTDVVEEGIPH